MADRRKITGSLGEQEARLFVEAQGYRIVDVNVRPLPGMARGEIDLVAWDRDCLVFIEVKTRRQGLSVAGAPLESVDARKRRQLIHLAAAYLAKYDLDDVPCRFDVVECLITGQCAPALRLIRNAFDAQDAGD